jgi:hypothetical protein
MTTIVEADLQLKHPFCLIVSGGSGSGKTEWIARLIQESARMINTKFDKIYYHYGIFNDKVLYLQQIGVQTVPGLPDSNVYFKSNNKPIFLILDDLLLEASQEFLQTLFTRASHHCNISVAFLTQSLFAKQLKVPRANCQYFAFLRNPASQLEIRNFGVQIFPKAYKLFLLAHADATKSPFGYLFVDLHTQSQPILRLRTDIFDNTIIYSI